MRRYKNILAVLFITLLFFSQEAFSQGFGRGMGRGMGYCGLGYANAGYGFQGLGQIGGYYQNALNLTQEQINKINEVQVKFRSENSDLWNNLYQKQIELQGLINNQKADPSAVNSKIDEISKIRAEVQKKSVTHREEIKNILTDEQKALFGDAGMGLNLIPYGREVACLGLGPRFGGRIGAGVGMGMGRGPCGMGLGRGAGRFGW